MSYNACALEGIETEPRRLKWFIVFLYADPNGIQPLQTWMLFCTLEYRSRAVVEVCGGERLSNELEGVVYG